MPFFGKLKESSFSEIDGGVMGRKKYWILRLFFVLFTMSVSAAILPCGIILPRGDTIVTLKVRIDD